MRVDMNKFVACLNHVRDTMGEAELEDYAKSIIGLCLKYEGQADRLGQEVLRLTLSTMTDES